MNSDPKVQLDHVRHLAPLVAAHAADAERERRQHDAVVEAIHATGLFRMLLPEADGGAGVPVSSTFPVIEAMARVDGAAGWNLAIGINSLAFASQVADPTARAALLDNPRALIAGSVGPFGIRAQAGDGGYTFSGKLAFTSGCAHATWLCPIAMLWNDDGPVFSPEGAPVLIAGLIDPGVARSLDSWHVAGLRGTGSDDLVIDAVEVPEARTFRPDRLVDPDHDPMGSLPLATLLGSGLAFVALGIAAHALDLLCDLAATKLPLGSQQPLRDRVDVQMDAARSRALIAGGRAHVLAAWHEVEGDLTGGGEPTNNDLAGLRLAYVAAAEQAVAAVDLVQRAAGSSALFEQVGLERCWRDVHAVTKHFAVSTRHLERVGRITLGLPAGPGPI